MGDCAVRRDVERACGSVGSVADEGCLRCQNYGRVALTHGFLRRRNLTIQCHRGSAGVAEGKELMRTGVREG